MVRLSSITLIHKGLNYQELKREKIITKTEYIWVEDRAILGILSQSYFENMRI